MKRSACISVIVLLTIGTLTSPVFGQSTWKGGSGSWGSAANWCGGVPNNADAVIGNCANGNPSVATVDGFPPTINNLTISGGNSVAVLAGDRLTIAGGSIANAGTFSLSGTGVSGGQIQLLAPTVTLSGGGSFLMNDTPNIVLGGNTNSTLVNQQTIRGAGTLGAGGLFNLNNQALVDAQGVNHLNIQNSFGTILNTGTLQASNGGTLQFQLAGNPGTLNNTGGMIKALDGSTVRLSSNTFISGGTLTTVGSGLIHGVNGGLANLTNAGLFQVGGMSGFGSAVIHLSGTITNAKTIQIGSPAWGDDGTLIDASVILTGGGTVNFANSLESMIGSSNTGNTLTNVNNTISGTGIIGGGNGLTLTNSGKVDANSPSGPLVLVMTMTNTGTMQASNGGELRTEGDINNAGGTIQALDGSKVTLVSNTIQGGTFATSGTGVIQAAPTQPALDGVTNTGLILVPNNGQMALKNTITNSGTISLDSTGGPVSFIISGPVTLTGKGTMELSNSANNFISGGPGAWSNMDNLIEGAGTVGVAFTNQKKGVVLADLTTPLQFNQGVTNLGTFHVNPGSSLLIPSATWTNFANNTLTGGTYIIGGTFTFGVPGNSSIVTNSANIQLTSPTAQITISGTNANALANFAANTKKGQLTVNGMATLTTTPNFINDGKVTIAAKSNFTVGGSYTQSILGTGTTKVDGTLTAPTGFSLQGGTLFGKGKIVSAVTSSASVTAGDTVKVAGKLSIQGSYTQQTNGSLNVQIGGATAGSKYSQLAVSNGVSLDGTLNITLINGFVPQVGNTFNIVTCSALSGNFATVNGLAINSSEHFKVDPPSATGVQLEVVSGALE